MTDWNTCPAVERRPGKLSGAWAFARSLRSRDGAVRAADHRPAVTIRRDWYY